MCRHTLPSPAEDLIIGGGRRTPVPLTPVTCQPARPPALPASDVSPSLAICVPARDHTLTQSVSLPQLSFLDSGPAPRSVLSQPSALFSIFLSVGPPARPPASQPARLAPLIPLAKALPGGDLRLGISEKGFTENTRYELHVTLRRSRQTEEGGRRGEALKGEFSTHPVCDRFLTLTRRWQVYTLNHDITRAALRGDSQGDFRLFKLRTRDHIASLKTAKQRHLNRVPTSQAGCHPLTEGSRDCDPARDRPAG